MFFYGALAVLFTIPWFFMPPEPQAARREASPAAQVPIGQAIRQVARLKNAWLLGFTLLGFGGCIQASLGYLPLYLRGQGWTGVLADSALSSFHLTSMIFVLPIVLWSDRLQARKKLLMGMGLMAVAGVGALSVTQGWVAWAAIILAGMVRDGFMALFMATIIETEGVGPALAGTATGFAMIFSMLGSVLAPPLGNSFAELAPGLPFLFWAALAALGVMSLSFTRADGAAGAPQPARSMKMEG
jgi:cyanate permease